MRSHDESAARQFTWRDRRRLRRALAGVREARVYRRLEAVLLVAEGQPVGEVARRVRAPRVTVHRWVARYARTRDPGALADRPRGGRPRVAAGLTPARLAAVLAVDPRTLGYRATTWTAPLLAHHLGEREGLALSERTLRRRLRERRYRWKRPRHVYAAHSRAAHVAQKRGA